MPGSFDLSPVPAAIAVPAAPIVVCKYDPTGENPYTILPNVYCLRIDYREGPEPPLARFQYFMDDLLDAALSWPSQFEQLWPIDAQGNYIVLNDDRLVVLTQGPPTDEEGDPETIVLFDGFAQIPQVDLSAGTQTVTFVAVGVAVRLWDDPILGCTQRNADQTGTTNGSADVFVQLPCRFNPSDTSIAALGGYIGNSVGSGDFTTDPATGNVYPVFIEPYLEERSTSDTNYWFISDALSYLIGVEKCPLDPGGNPYVVYPEIGSLADLLGTYAPPDNGLLNAGDAQMSNCKIRDYDASNKAVPDVFAELLRYAGFVMVFSISTADGGTPQTSLQIKRRDGLSTTTPKLLCLAADGASSLDLAANNVTAIHLARDCNTVVNSWTVETALQQYEITVTLAPGFQPASGDNSPANLPKWLKANLTGATDASRRMYRWWIADECGDGHWDASNTSWVTDTPLDLSSVFPPTLPTSDDDGTTTPADPGYCRRYRPGSKTIIAKDSNNRPLKAVLQIKVDTTSADPRLRAVGDSLTGWITAPHGWQLLDDRLGIELTVSNPNEWQINAVNQLSGGAALTKINAVDWTADPTASGNQPFELQLTTVIEADKRMKVEAPKRVASPTKFERRRSADGKDHFQYCAIDLSSINYKTQTDMSGNPSDGTNPLVMRDDTKAATTHAEQLRAAHEFPTLAGSATVPFITDYYQIGDRVQIIQGRNASLQINVGASQGETPSYPWITAFAWDFQGDKQQTILQFSDRRAEPQGV